MGLMLFSTKILDYVIKQFSNQNSKVKLQLNDLSYKMPYNFNQMQSNSMLTHKTR